MILRLAYYNDPILRKKAAKVQEITPEIRQLVQDMIETLDSTEGIGIAAPQVFQSLAIFITRAPISSSQDREQWEPGPTRVFINPVLSNPSPEVWEASEGCLSIPGIYETVQRPWKITIEAMDLDGNLIKEELQGWQARVAMHENDHINGVLFIDRVLGKPRQAMEPKLRAINKKYHP